MTTLADADVNTVKTVYPRPSMNLIETDIGPHGLNLYIGDTEAARDIPQLRAHGIAIIVNCAVNLDINYVADPRGDTGNGKCGHGSGPIRMYKLGLVDGPGNPERMMLGGYYILDGAIRQEFPDKPSYPHREVGHVLVHCRGGRSRSTALVALFLHLNKPDRYPTLDDAVAHVRETRELHPNEWYEAPKPMLIEAARKAIKAVHLLAASGI